MTDLDKRHDTRAASAFLTERGYKTAPSALNKMRCVGGGPEFELFGRRPLYKETALLEWAQARTTPPLRSTSDSAGSTAAQHLVGSNARPVEHSGAAAATLKPRQLGGPRTARKPDRHVP